MYYPGEEKLVSLDVLKLYWGEDVVRQNLEDVDPDQGRLDEGELTELLQISIEEAEVGLREQPEDQRRPELYPKPDLDIPILPKDAVEEVMLEIPPEWNAVPDLIMEEEEGMMITEADTKQKRDKVGGNGGRKRISIRRNVNIHPGYLREHKTQQDFFSEDWDEL